YLRANSDLNSDITKINAEYDPKMALAFAKWKAAQSSGRRGGRRYSGTPDEEPVTDYTPPVLDRRALAGMGAGFTNLNGEVSGKGEALLLRNRMR
ncbi:MAG: hypothetical protein IJP17_06755, partial [Clostridia bacterium]|nr:hypothetical protein [Clostridia bacterium]